MNVIEMDNKKLYLISFFTFFIDIISKLFIINNLVYGDRVTVIRKLFYINYVRNKGIAFSFLSGNLMFIIIVTFFIFYVMYKYLKDKKLREIEVLGYGLIIGGAIGNLFDRLVYGYVIDFIDIYLFNYDFPVFNIADCGIVIGILLIGVDTILNGSGDKDEDKGRRKGKN